MFHKLFKLVLIIGSLTVALNAVEKDESRIYMGLGVGGSAYVDSGFAKEQIAGVDKEVTQDGIGSKIYGGYEINRIIAIEAAYVYYGSFKVTDHYKYSAQGLSLSGNVGYTFFRGQLRPYLLIGLGYIFSNFPHDSVDVEDYSPSLHTGLGMTYVPKSLGGVGFRVAYESNSFIYTIDEDTVDEKQYAQGFGILYLGVEYKF